MEQNLEIVANLKNLSGPRILDSTQIPPFGIEVLSHSPYSCDCRPIEFHVFFVV